MGTSVSRLTEGFSFWSTVLIPDRIRLASASEIGGTDWCRETFTLTGLTPAGTAEVVETMPVVPLAGETMRWNGRSARFPLLSAVWTKSLFGLFCLRATEVSPRLG